MFLLYVFFADPGGVSGRVEWKGVSARTGRGREQARKWR